MTEFTFDPVKHEYRLDGEVIPGITQVLGFLSQRSLQDIPDQDVVERARERGVAAHKSVEAYSRTGEVSNDPYLPAWIAFVKSTGFKPTHIEFLIYSARWRFACTIDVLGTLPDGRMFLPDIKTSSWKPKWHPLQTAGQAIALSSHGLCPRDVARANVYLHQDGTYTLDIHESPIDFIALAGLLCRDSRWADLEERYA